MHTQVMKHLLSSFYIRLQCMILCWLLFTKRSILIVVMLLYPQIRSIWGLYRSHAWRSVGPLVWTFLVNTISQQPFVRNQYNFTRMIDTKPSCAYCRRVALELFLNALWPLEFLIHSWSIDISCEHYFSATLGQNSI